MSVKKTFLWRISNDRLPGASYLFGTMHVQDLRAFSNLQLVQEKILECESFAAEFHLDQTPTTAAQKMALPEGVSLKDLLSKKKYLKTRLVLLKATGLDLDFFIQTSPFMLTGLIGSQLLGKEMPQSLDEYLWHFAKSNDKNLRGIETFEEQMEVLEKIPLQMQVKMLLGLSSNINSFRKHTLHLAELYQNGEFQRLSKSVKKNAKGLRKLLLYHRNEVMAERIFESVKTERLFAAIGAGHLGGGKGVIRLLKKKGLTLKPIATQSEN
ncbi:MAG: TraB/GumN family protein [Saprospiraceae bacterium]